LCVTVILPLDSTVYPQRKDWLYPQRKDWLSWSAHVATISCSVISATYTEPGLCPSVGALSEISDTKFIAEVSDTKFQIYGHAVLVAPRTDSPVKEIRTDSYQADVLHLTRWIHRLRCLIQTRAVRVTRAINAESQIGRETPRTPLVNVNASCTVAAAWGIAARSARAR
jgi:hypothetical protein